MSFHTAPDEDPTAIFNHGDIDLTMVVPYFNPGKALRPNIESLIIVLNDLGITYEIIAVSDGSTDGSELTLTDIPSANLRLVNIEQNTGKGHALRVGFAQGRGRYLGFIDADGDIDPIILKTFWEKAEGGRPDIVYGSKLHADSSVQYPLIRRIYSRGYQTLIRVLFRLKVRDTQVGLKLIRRDVLAAALTRMLEKRFAFDLELFVVAQHLGYRTFEDSPLTINHQFTSTISRRTVVGMMLDTFAIFYRLNIRRYYDKPHRLVLADGGIELTDES